MTISKWGDPQGFEPGSVLVKPLVNRNGAGNIEVNDGDNAFGLNAAVNATMVYLPLADAINLRADGGLIDF